MNDSVKHPVSRRELRKRIIETAMGLFSKQGIRSVTMDDIAATFGISKRTLYEVFADKESLLIEHPPGEEKEHGIRAPGGRRVV